MEEHQENNYRYERKYVFHQTKYYYLISQLHQEGFIEIYNPRFVNNIYLDDWEFSSVVDNVDGISSRKKHRIRWYGEPFELSNKFYEKKIKEEFVGEKKVDLLGEFKLDSLEKIDAFYNDNFIDRFKYGLSPKLFNSYHRKYFIDSKGDIRITVDSNLFFYSPLTKLNFKDFKIIVEIKYDSFQPFLNKLKNFNMTKYSKYVKGISQTTFYLPDYNSQ